MKTNIQTNTQTKTNSNRLRSLSALFILVSFALPACSSDNGSATQGGSAQAQEAQVMYESFSILGMMMAQIQNEVAAKPNPEMEQRMRDAGRAYLQSLFKDDVDKVVITEKGLVIQ
jgi:hypothetical protein